MSRNIPLNVAILGLLAVKPLHGYEIRKQLMFSIGTIKTISFGSLYKELSILLQQNLIREVQCDLDTPPSRRRRICYQITEEGSKRFSELLQEVGSEAWEDETFNVYFSLFTRIAASVRIQILFGRKVRLQEKINFLQKELNKTKSKLDTYNLKFKKYKIDSVRSEIKWIDEVISSERKEI